MVGSWAGSGFNTIFRPMNAKSPNQLPTPVPGSDNILELNLTSENTTFTAVNGIIPNRGFSQVDIALSGMIYLQQISDVTSGAATGIHVEPGIWVVIPSTTSPDEVQSVARMASIPHGTTINAQGTTTTFPHAPKIPAVSITPVILANGSPFSFPSQVATNAGTARIPQDLSALLAEKKITQQMLDNPNIVLENAIANQTIVSTTEISISTTATPPIVAGGGTDNIAFLGPNADAVLMTATFWIETVSQKIKIPIFKPGNPPVRVPLRNDVPQQLSPVLTVDPGREVTAEREITVQFKQIQYSQTVNLNFNGLRWPHVSVATLVSTTPLAIPPSAWA